ncbi:hypothetical protein [Oricola sp.]|uniref:hypothetical protein n=1 Tax=Oricola sp. TaxID=1979950 RepID=UPI0025F36590|nr:hypothetical protein [Oricola sp.]MCI5077127.1 hypothetical protein [Oricola sp.]
MQQTGFDWPLAIERNRAALLRIVAGLFAMAALGDDGEGAAGTMPRRLRTHVLRVLKPAESAARRLVFILARGLVVSLPANAAAPGIVGRGNASGSGQRVPSFGLLDALKRYSPNPPRRYATTMPRATWLGLNDPRPLPEIVVAMPGDPVDAVGLRRRLTALQGVLGDLPRAARRMARWEARRARDRALPDRRRGRLAPLRQGRPPGLRRQHTHSVDGILAECHQLAVMAREAPDTS